MCLSEQSQVLAFLQPPKGPALKLKQGETWIGRGTFDLSLKAQRLCSRRQACIHFDHFSISIECQGINPVHFVTCQFQKFQSCPEAEPTEFYRLPKGEVIQLKHGDQFFLASSECLITVVIRPLVSNNLASVIHLSSNLHLLVPLESKNETDSFQKTTVSEVGIDLTGKTGELLPMKADLNCRSVDCWLNEKPGAEFTDQQIDKMLTEEVVEVVDVECEVNKVDSSSCVSPPNLLSFHQRKPFSNVNVVPKHGTKSVTSPITHISLGEKLVANMNCSEVSSAIPEASGAVMARAREREHVFLDTNPHSISEIIENEHSMETFCEPEFDSHQTKKEANSIMGGESVITTVSGYSLAERDKLVRLILQTGAYYIGGLSKDKPITHVVCWRFSGKKYELAKKWGKVIVNHRWFEDCLKAGKRLNEKSYTLASGEFVGHVKWEEKGACYLKQGDQWLSPPETVSTPQVLSEEIGSDHPKAALACEQNHEVTENPAYQPHERFEEHSKVSVICKDIHRNSPREASARPQEHKHFQTNEIHQSENGVITTEEKRSMGAWSNHYDEKIKSAGCQEQSLQLGCYRQLEKELLRKPILPFKMNVSTWPSSSKRNKRTDASPKKGLYEQLLLKRGKRQVLTKYQNPRLKSPSEKCRLEYQPSTSSWESTPSNREISKSNDQQNSDSCVALEEESLDLLRVESCVSPTPAAEVTCVICQDQLDCSEEGLLTCGHKFCFPCIRRWAYKAQCKAPNCPLCKAPFDFIIKREVLEKSNDKGVTFITASKEISETVIMVRKQDGVPNLLQLQELSCILCQSRDTEDLLLVCNGCRERAAHTFCLDPPWPAASGGPWFCARCARSFR